MMAPHDDRDDENARLRLFGGERRPGLDRVQSDTMMDDRVLTRL